MLARSDKESNTEISKHLETWNAFMRFTGASPANGTKRANHPLLSATRPSAERKWSKSGNAAAWCLQESCYVLERKCNMGKESDVMPWMWNANDSYWLPAFVYSVIQKKRTNLFNIARILNGQEGNLMPGVLRPTKMLKIPGCLESFFEVVLENYIYIYTYNMYIYMLYIYIWYVYMYIWYLHMYIYIYIIHILYLHIHMIWYIYIYVIFTYI